MFDYFRFILVNIIYSIINTKIAMVLWYASFKERTLQKEGMTFGHVSTLEQLIRTNGLEFTSVRTLMFVSLFSSLLHLMCSCGLGLGFIYAL